jgi:hypothetical protein
MKKLSCASELYVNGASIIGDSIIVTILLGKFMKLLQNSSFKFVKKYEIYYFCRPKLTIEGC